MEILIFIITGILILLMILICLLFLPAIITIIKMLYYEQIEGIVIDKEIKHIETTDAGGKFSHYKYEFSYLGNTYKIEDKGYGYHKKLEVGDKIVIYIKKGNPKKYIYPNRVRDRYIFLCLSLVGIVPLLFILKLFLFDL